MFWIGLFIKYDFRVISVIIIKRQKII